MARTDTGRDSDNLKRLEALRPAFERLRTERILAEGEIERLTKELEAARQLALQELGTDDEAEIARMIAAARDRNTAMVEEFATLIRDIDARLQRLGTES